MLGAMIMQCSVVSHIATAAAVNKRNHVEHESCDARRYRNNGVSSPCYGGSSLKV